VKIDHPHLWAAFKQFVYHGSAYIACSACYQNFHLASVAFLFDFLDRASSLFFRSA
jgi:hypothetical protein